MNENCPQYKYSFEEQKKRFPLFDEFAYRDFETLRDYICCICEDESGICKYNTKTKKGSDLTAKRKELIIMEKNKVTVVGAIDYVLDNCSIPAEIREKFEAMKASQLKKNASTAKKSSAVTEKNAEVAAMVLDGMTADREYTLDELVAEFIQPHYEDTVSTSKASTIMKPLVDNGNIIKGKSKGKVTYKLA